MKYANPHYVFSQIKGEGNWSESLRLSGSDAQSDSK